MKKILTLSTLVCALTISGAAIAENKCGWIDNPTPANASLIDKDGIWSIFDLNGKNADGDLPDFADNQFIKTNVNYGYGCACLEVKSDKKNKQILKIISSKIKPISVCKNDKKLTYKKEIYDGIQH